jgi:F-type H+-transporting ATPase subunit b
VTTRTLTQAVCGALWLATPALAAEGEPDIFAGGIGNAIITLVIFVSVVLILGKYAWPPLMRVLSERERTIRESLEDAKREREEAERVLEKYTRQIEQARVEASKIVDAGRRNAEEVARRVHEEARDEAGQMVVRARREIQLAADAAKKEVYDLAAELAVDVAGRIIRKELSAADHKELVAESLARMRAEEAETD